MTEETVSAAPFTPELGQLFYVTCHKREKVSTGAFGMSYEMVRCRDYEHALLRMVASDETSIVGSLEGSAFGVGKPVVLRRADYTFSPVGEAVAAAMGFAA